MSESSLNMNPSNSSSSIVTNPKKQSTQSIPKKMPPQKSREPKQDHRKQRSNKKNQISLNHLLHYESYKELNEYKVRRSMQKRNKRPSRGSFDYSPDRYKVPLRGMSFINLNYKFIVDERGDFRPQELDPNVPVGLDNIIRIIAPKGNSCPICLSDDIVAPRMITACGHVLCLKCLLSLLDTEIPSFKKNESAAVVEKYNDCPLCSAIIRKNEVKPVLTVNVDDRFETPKIGDDVVMTLMSRPHSKLFALPRAIEDAHYHSDNFPSVDMKDPDLSLYLRLFKADLTYILRMYHEEKEKILQAYKEEKELYNDDGKYFMLSIEEIDKEIQKWMLKYNTESAPQHPTIVKKEEMNTANSFFYYETGFNARSTFVLSPLDIKILKTNYNDDYSNLPSSIIVKVENIQYEELTPENSLKKYKYLSHLPLGTSIGFLQCNWYKNEFISQDTWNTFKADLVKRTKKSQKKLQREDRDKKRAESEEERRTRLFYERENDPTRNHHFSDYADDGYELGSFGSLSIVDNREMPTLSQDNEEEAVAESDISSADYKTTVWGTKVKKSDATPTDASSDEWDAEEMIKRAKEEMERQETSGKRKKKKKLILFSSN